MTREESIMYKRRDILVLSRRDLQSYINSIDFAIERINEQLDDYYKEKDKK